MLEQAQPAQLVLAPVQQALGWVRGKEQDSDWERVPLERSGLQFQAWVPFKSCTGVSAPCRARFRIGCMEYTFKVCSISRKETDEAADGMEVMVELNAKRTVSGVGDNQKPWSFPVVMRHCYLYMSSEEAESIKVGDSFVLTRKVATDQPEESLTHS